MDGCRAFLYLILFLGLLSACLGSSSPGLKPPNGDSDKKVPLYRDGQKLEIDEKDITALIGDMFGPDYLLYNANTDVSHTQDTGIKVREQLDDLLPEANWRLESDWYALGQFYASTWRYGDLHVLVAYLDNLDSEQISNLKRRYGVAGPEPGSTLIVAHIWDMTQPSSVAPIPEGPVTVLEKVDARRGWQPTGLLVRQGMTLKLDVTGGQWTHWEDQAPFNGGEGGTYTCANAMPAGQCVEPLPDFPVGALIGRVEGQVFGVGRAYSAVLAGSGTLFLRINDADHGLFDNDGVLTVRATVEP